MSHDFPDEHLSRSVLYDDNDAKIVPCDIEDHKGRHIVGRVVELLDVREIPEVRVLDNRMPLAQSIFRCGMLLPELSKHLEGYDVHGLIISN
jgi:hypothetical protein